MPHVDRRLSRSRLFRGLGCDHCELLVCYMALYASWGAEFSQKHRLPLKPRVLTLVLLVLTNGLRGLESPFAIRGMEECNELGEGDISAVPFLQTLYVMMKVVVS